MYSDADVYKNKNINYKMQKKFNALQLKRLTIIMNLKCSSNSIIYESNVQGNFRSLN